MIPNAPTIAVPFREDERGTIRVSGTRVTLDSLINYYLQGQSPEDLHEGFPTVPLADIYAVIAYYLANRESVDAYLEQQAAEAERTPAQRARDERLRQLAAERRRTQGE